MSKIGKLPITVPQGVQVKLDGSVFSASNAKETLNLNIPNQIKVTIDGDTIKVDRDSEVKHVKSKHGTIRSLIQNMVTGLITPWQKSLEVRGTGYKVAVNGSNVVLTVGYINPVSLPIPQGVTATTDGDTKITLSGANKIVVGQFASNLRKVRTPEPYKGKGVRYVDEFIKLKPGKAAKTGA